MSETASISQSIQQSFTQETNDDEEYESFEPSEKHKRSPDDSNEQKNQQQQQQQSANNESKKRRLEDDKSNDKSKRNNNGRQRNANSSSKNGSGRKSTNNTSRTDSATQEVHLKVLIPQGAAGGVIGHKGEKIGQIQKDSHCRIKMSKSNEYYPNTTERVCLIVGQAKSVVKAYELINARIQDRPDRSIDDERLKEIRILIPSNTAGLLIGKGGSYIKTIKDSSSAFVQVSHKTNELPERIVTIEGSEERRMKALEMVVEKIAEDPQHNMITTLVYNSTRDNNNSMDERDLSMDRGFSSQVANFMPALPVIQNNVASIAGLNNLSMLIVNSGGASQMTADSLMDSLGVMGYMPHASKEIIDAVSVLMRYGLIVKQEQPLGNAINPVNLQGNSSSSMNSSSYGDRDNYQRGSQNQRSSGNHGMMNANNNNNNYNSYNENNNSMSSQNNNLNNPMNNVLQMLRNSMGKQSQNSGY